MLLYNWAFDWPLIMSLGMDLYYAIVNWLILHGGQGAW